LSVSTDCEASGEYSETDSTAHETDTSEGVTDSVATCLQETETSTKGRLGSSVNPLTPPKDFATPVQTTIQMQKVVMRANTKRSVRPWSISRSASPLWTAPAKTPQNRTTTQRGTIQTPVDDQEFTEEEALENEETK
jgi:hypothetical protein